MLFLFNINLLAWYQRINFKLKQIIVNIKKEFYFDYIFDDLKTIFYLLKIIDFKFYPLILVLLPIFWIIYIIFLILILFFILLFKNKFIIRFFKSYFFNELQPDLIYNFPRIKKLNINQNIINYLVLFLIFFYNMPKKSAFLYFYNFSINLQNKFKLGNFNNLSKYLIMGFLFFIIKFLFLLVISCNLKVLKFSLQFINEFQKNYKIKKLNKSLSNNIFIQQIFINFFLIYDSYLTKNIIHKKIKFTEKGVIFNPLKI